MPPRKKEDDDTKSPIMPPGATWLKLVPWEISMVADEDLKKLAPKNPPTENEIPLGKASEAAKRLYIRWMQLQKAAAEMKIKIEYEQSGNPSPEEYAQLSELIGKSEIYKRLFWCSLNDEFSCWEKYIGVRRGWIVVETEGPKMPDVLKFFLGGGG